MNLTLLQQHLEWSLPSLFGENNSCCVGWTIRILLHPVAQALRQQVPLQFLEYV